ncbi:MAG: hypothetical protein ABL879_00885 [Devosia sp.]
MALTQVPAMVETRPVGEQERIFHYLHTMGGLIASGTSHVSGPLTPELLRRAMNWLQRQNPILASHIRYEGHTWRSAPPFYFPTPWFDMRGTAEIPISVITDPDPEAWRAIALKEAKTTIKVDKRKLPRMRLVLVRPHEGSQHNHLIMTFDHAIADAQSGSMMIDQLFRYLADPETMEKQPPVQIGLPPALETGLPAASGEKKPYQPAIRFPKTEVANPVKASLSVERRLGANIAEPLRAALRSHKATMHGAIGAAFMGAARDKFGMKELTVLSTVELRRMMKPQLPVSSFGCYIDILRTKHAVSHDFWKMAGDVSFKLINAIARDRHNASILKIFGWDMYKAEFIPILTHRNRIDGIAITTAGESYAGINYGPFSFEQGGSGGVTIDLFGPSLFIVTTEKEGAVDLLVGYPGYVLSTEDAEDLTDRAIAELTAAAEAA